MASVYDKYYERQPPVVKIIVVGGLGLLGYSIYRSLRRDADERDAKQAARAAGDELSVLASQGILPSYTDSQYYAWVNILVQAMNGCGTDEQLIYDVFDWLENDADIRKLIIAFDVQYYEPCSVSSPISYVVWQFNSKAYGGDLATWLGYDLSASNLGKINSILKGKGINYQF